MSARACEREPEHPLQGTVLSLRTTSALLQMLFSSEARSLGFSSRAPGPCGLLGYMHTCAHTRMQIPIYKNIKSNPENCPPSHPKYSKCFLNFYLCPATSDASVHLTLVSLTIIIVCVHRVPCVGTCGTVPWRSQGKLLKMALYFHFYVGSGESLLVHQARGAGTSYSPNNLADSLLSIFYI